MSLEIMSEACEGIQLVRRRMFGGYGFFAPNGGMFAGVLSDGAVILRLALGEAREELIALGGQPWVFEGRAKPITMHQWIVIPDSFYDDTDSLHVWLKRAHALAPSKVREKKPDRVGSPASRVKAAKKTKPSAGSSVASLRETRHPKKVAKGTSRRAQQRSSSSERRKGGAV